MTALAEELEQVTPDQIKHFDHDAIHLVAQYHFAGWRSHMTSNGHVFLKAPDGTETASVSRESLRGRSGRNAAAPLKRWRRRIEQERRDKEAAERKRAGAAFGITDMTTAKANDPLASVPPRVAKAIRESAEVIAYIGDNYQRFTEDNVSEALYISVEGDGPRPAWEMWCVVDVEKNVLVAHGPGYTRAEALKMLRDEGRLPPASGEELMAEIEGTTCPQCGHEAKTNGGLLLHLKSQHTGFHCPECGVQTGFSGRGLAWHRETEHGVLQPRKAKAREALLAANACSDCDERFESPQGLAAHERRVHGRDVRGKALSLIKSLDRPARTQDIIDGLKVTETAAKSTLSRLTRGGDIVRVAHGLYTVPGKDVTVTSPDVTPDGDSETGSDDVTVTSPDVPATPAVVPAALDDLDATDAAAVVAKIRAAVAPAMVAQLHEMAKERDAAIEERDMFKRQAEELRTQLALVREQLGPLRDALGLLHDD